MYAIHQKHHYLAGLSQYLVPRWEKLDEGSCLILAFASEEAANTKLAELQLTYPGNNKLAAAKVVPLS